MNLAIVHYHLNRGGVTQVVRNHVSALAAARAGGDISRVAILTGEDRNGWPSGPITDDAAIEPQLVAVGGLDYDDANAADYPNPIGLAHNLKLVLDVHAMTPSDTVIHVHNHSLGKNKSLPGAVAQLAGDGYRFLLQIHDFAEDFRPKNYRHIQRTSAIVPDDDGVGLYPQSPSIHFAVLNGRDQSILSRAGVDDSRLHLLPNPVAPFGELPDREKARIKLANQLDVPRAMPYFLYPVRGIRRKNVGEMVLWSALLCDRATLGITLRPRNPAEAASYDRWSALAGELGLQCRFGVGEEGGLSFQENLAACDAVMTTSVAEGFGMVFLEAWLAGRPLVGRDLPEITADFACEGVTLPWLYDRLAIPLSMVDGRAARSDLEKSYRDACRDYHQPPLEQPQFDQIFDRMTAEDVIDFAFLRCAAQADVIRQAATNGTFRDALLERNPSIEEAVSLADQPSTAATIAENAAVIERRYGLEPLGQRLHDLYQTILATSGDSALAPLADADTILPSFLAPDRLHPIRLEP